MILADPDDFVHRELVEAVSLGITVVPVLLGRVSKPVASELPKDLATLADLQYRHVDPRSDPYDMQMLIDTVAKFLGEDASPKGSNGSLGQHADTIVNGGVRADGSAIVIGGGSATYNATASNSDKQRFRGSA
jgi:hypothetical protein